MDSPNTSGPGTSALSLSQTPSGFQNENEQIVATVRAEWPMPAVSFCALMDPIKRMSGVFVKHQFP